MLVAKHEDEFKRDDQLLHTVQHGSGMMSMGEFLRGHALGKQLDTKTLESSLTWGEQTRPASMVNRLCSAMGLEVVGKQTAEFSLVKGGFTVCTIRHPYWKLLTFDSDRNCTNKQAAYESACKQFLNTALLECKLPRPLNADLPLDPVVEQIQKQPDIVQVVDAGLNPKAVNAWIATHIYGGSSRDKPTSVVVVAFDLEWQSQTKELQLIQLAVSSGHCLLVRTHKLHGEAKSENAWPAELVKLFQQAEVSKVGLCIQQDVLTLAQTPALSKNHQVVDIVSSTMAGKGYSQNIGLQKLMRYELGTRLEHPRRITLSNFGGASLSREQIQYAALDAIVVLRLMGQWPLLLLLPKTSERKE